MGHHQSIIGHRTHTYSHLAAMLHSQAAYLHVVKKKKNAKHLGFLQKSQTNKKVGTHWESWMLHLWTNSQTITVFMFEINHPEIWNLSLWVFFFFFVFIFFKSHHLRWTSHVMLNRRSQPVAEYSPEFQIYLLKVDGASLYSLQHSVRGTGLLSCLAREWRVA